MTLSCLILNDDGKPLVLIACTDVIHELRSTGARAPSERDVLFYFAKGRKGEGCEFN